MAPRLHYPRHASLDAYNRKNKIVSRMSHIYLQDIKFLLSMLSLEQLYIDDTNDNDDNDNDDNDDDNDTNDDDNDTY